MIFVISLTSATLVWIIQWKSAEEFYFNYVKMEQESSDKMTERLYQKLE